MANKTAHIVGGGLGTFRKEATARAEAANKAKQDAERKQVFARIASAK